MARLTALVRATVIGPEGGGQLVYELWGPGKPARQRYELSSTLSSGDGKKNERVDAKTCTERVNALDAELKKRGFKDVKTQAQFCAKHGEQVVVDKRAATEVAAAKFMASGNKLAHEGLEVRFRGTAINVFKDERLLCTIVQPKREAPTEIHVSGSKSGRLVYVTEQSSAGDQGLLGMCAATGAGQLTAQDITH